MADSAAGVSRGPRPWVSRTARAAYALLLRALLPAYVLRLWWRGAAEPLYRHAIGERFGFYAAPPSSGWLWLHAVSLGETRAAAALVDALRVSPSDTACSHSQLLLGGAA